MLAFPPNLQTTVSTSLRTDVGFATFSPTIILPVVV